MSVISISSVAELKAKVEIAENSLQAQSNLVAEKEKETARKVQSVREEEWEKVSQLETEKYVICKWTQTLARYYSYVYIQEKLKIIEKILYAFKRCQMAWLWSKKMKLSLLIIEGDGWNLFFFSFFVHLLGWLD